MVLYPTNVLTGLSMVGGFWAIVGIASLLNSYIDLLMYKRLHKKTSAEESVTNRSVEGLDVVDLKA